MARYFQNKGDHKAASISASRSFRAQVAWWSPSLTLFEVALFCFRGNAPAVCLAQPNGLGIVKTRSFQGQRPDHLEAHRMT
jgi:hypothetical protein